MLGIYPFPNPQDHSHRYENIREDIAPSLLVLMGLLKIDISFANIHQCLLSILLNQNGLVLLIVNLHLKLLKYLRQLYDNALGLLDLLGLILPLKGLKCLLRFSL